MKGMGGPRMSPSCSAEGPRKWDDSFESNHFDRRRRDVGTRSRTALGRSRSPRRLLLNIDPFFTRLNPVIGAVLRSPFHWLLSSGLVLLTVTGRRSGRRYSIPVGYQRRGDGLVILVSNADTKQWWRNYRLQPGQEQPGSVELRLRGRRVDGQAVVVEPESREFGERVEASFRRMPWLGRQFGIHYDKRTGLGDEQLAHLRQTAAVVRVSLEDEQPQAG